MDNDRGSTELKANVEAVRVKYPRAFHYRTTRKHYAVMVEPMGRCLGTGRRVAGAWANAAAVIEVEAKR